MSDDNDQVRDNIVVVDGKLTLLTGSLVNWGDSTVCVKIEGMPPDRGKRLLVRILEGKEKDIRATLYLHVPALGMFEENERLRGDNSRLKEALKKCSAEIHDVTKIVERTG